MGFEQTGFDVLWANDVDKAACETYRQWSNAYIVSGDICSIDSSEIPDIDVILGGFPCQGFSFSGPRKADDSRNRLYKEYVRIVRDKQPLAFIGENVKGLLTIANGEIIAAIVNEFSDCGYDVFYQLIDAKNYGVPQDRKRVIITGFRKDLCVKDFSIPTYTGMSTVLADVLGNIHSKPDEICTDPFSSRFMSRNRKRNWDEVSYTIPAMAKQVTLHPDSPDMVRLGRDSWRFGDNGETRRLSWRECAAIQTFPADMEFVGDLKSKYKQIGNAVPVKLAQFTASAVRSVLEASL